MTAPLNGLSGVQSINLSNEPDGQERPRSEAEGHHGGNRYRPGRRGQAPDRPRRSPVRARRGRLRRLGQLDNPEIDDEDLNQDLAGNLRRDERRFEPAAGLQFDQGDERRHSSGEGAGGRESRGGGRLLRFKPPPALRAVDDLQQRLSQEGSPGAGVLFGKAVPGSGVDAHALRTALASFVLAAAHRWVATTPGRGLARFVLAAGHAQLQRQTPHGAAVLHLDDVKQQLLSACNQVWGGKPTPHNPPENVGDLLAVLPLQLLNTARPRTWTQHRNALDRQLLLLRTAGL